MAQMLGSCRLLFGTAGWSYPDWEGIVYPRGTSDRLRYLAGFVDLLEVNTSFYQFLSPATAESWLARTADLPDFRFSAKANRLFTHEDAASFGPPETRAFARGLEPLLRAGRLVALLFQFPFTFRDAAAARARLADLSRAFAGYPLVAEVRHKSWEADAALGFLGGLGFSVANLDLPVASDSFRHPAAATGEPGYLRLHGRNARDWFSRAAGRDAKYDYLYEDDELDDLAGRIEALARRFRELVIVTNNHYRGQALANLAELAARTGAPSRPLPAGLVRAFPRLAAIARPVESDSGTRRTWDSGEGGGGRGNPPAGAQRDLFDV